MRESVISIYIYIEREGWWGMRESIIDYIYIYIYIDRDKGVSYRICICIYTYRV